MPESDQPKAGEDAIIARLKATRPKRVLDVGPGPGRWGRLARDLGLTCDAVEIWQGYIERYSLPEIYAEVIHRDVREIDEFSRWDAIIFSDVLEHMPKDDARRVIHSALELDIRRAAQPFARLEGATLYLSIPTTDCPQAGDSYGNPYEAHVAQWSHEELLAWGWRELHRGPVPSGLATVGTYVAGKLPIASIAITTRNRGELLMESLAAIQSMDYQSTETVVLDDASDDGTPAMLGGAPWVISHRIERNGGYRQDPAPVFNQSLRLSAGDVLIQQSAEVIHLTPVARQLVDVCAPGVVAFATVLAGDRFSLHGARAGIEQGYRFPGGEWQGPNAKVIDPQGIRPDGGHGVVTPPVPITIGGRGVEIYTGHERPAPLFFCGAIHRADWERSGGYPEGIPHGASDLHFAFKLQEMGVRFVFLGGAVAYHLEHGKR